MKPGRIQLRIYFLSVIYISVNSDEYSVYFREISLEPAKISSSQSTTAD